MTKSEMLVDDGTVFLGNGMFLDVAAWADGSVTIAVVTATGVQTGETRFAPETPQALIAHAVMVATKEGAF
jgi:hypothetical protein